MRAKTIIPLFILLFAAFNLNAQNSTFWGMTTEGGEFGLGTIFTTDATGNNPMVKYSFPKQEGKGPTGDVVQAGNGKLYGMATAGGKNDDGVLFEYDPKNYVYVKKLDFESTTTGKWPAGSLLLATNGKLYGMTPIGGINNEGVIFEYDPVNEIFLKKLDFDGINTGGKPRGTLIQATNGKFYGMTSTGGANNLGVLFEYDPAVDSFLKILDFDGTNTGAKPEGNLLQASNGKLYGLTFSGGNNNIGVLFEYNITSQTFIKKFDFNGFNSGYYPKGALAEAANGLLYGVTSDGGNNYHGVLFEYNPTSSIYTKKIDFENIQTGRSPSGSLLHGKNGKMYGLSRTGGSNSSGVLFEYDPSNNSFAKKVEFERPQGWILVGSLMQASNGNLYGMSVNGGSNDNGVLFEFNPSNSNFSTLLSFDGALYGAFPSSALIQGPDGMLYGTTHEGGNRNYGVLFKFDPKNSTLININNFNNENGMYPIGKLLLSNGKLYGTTNRGGSNFDGVVFEYNIQLDTLITTSFLSQSTGERPRCTLIEATNGKFYGGTYAGGMNNYGVLFEYDPVLHVITKIMDFDGSNSGRSSEGALLQITAENLYGVTSGGGSYAGGVLFEYNITTNTYTKKFDFGQANKGRSPITSLIQLSNGKIIGMTATGGFYGKGTIFEFDPKTETVTHKIDFNGAVNGEIPFSSLLPASNGNLYSMASEGGAYDKGIMFQYNPNTNTFLKLLDFNDTIGSNPYIATGLIEVFTCYPTASTINPTACFEYLSPSGKYTWDTDGTYFDTIPNVAGCDSFITINLSITKPDTSVSVSGTMITSGAAGSSYRWLDCNNSFAPIPGETNQSYTATVNGDYAVEVTTNSCVDTSSCIQITSVGFANVAKENRFSIYPNPTTGRLKIEIPGEMISEIAVFNTMGQKFLSEWENSEINLSGNAEGIYLILVKTTANEYRTKVLLRE